LQKKKQNFQKETRKTQNFFINQTFIISITLLLESKELILNIILYINIYLPPSSSVNQTNETIAGASQIQRKLCDTNTHNRQQKNNKMVKDE